MYENCKESVFVYRVARRPSAINLRSHDLSFLCKCSRLSCKKVYFRTEEMTKYIIDLKFICKTNGARWCNFPNLQKSKKEKYRIYCFKNQIENLMNKWAVVEKVPWRWCCSPQTKPGAIFSIFECSSSDKLHHSPDISSIKRTDILLGLFQSN